MAQAQAEQQLRRIVPFEKLVTALLEVPLSAEEQDAAIGSSSSSSSSSGGGLLLGSKLTAVFGQIGEDLGAWYQGKLLHDWHDSANCLVEECLPAAAVAAAAAAGSEPHTATPASSSSSTCVLPIVLSVTPWTTSASASARGQVRVQLCIAKAAAATAASSGGGEGDVEMPVKLWATMRNAFCTLDSKAIQQQQQQQQQQHGLVYQVTVQLPKDAAGLLLIQAERQLPLPKRLLQNAATPSAAAGPGQHDHDSCSVMSMLVPVIVCSSAEMAAEVEDKLHTQPKAAAYQMLVQLGLLLDFAAMLKQQQQQQQQQQGEASAWLAEQQLQHRQQLLSSRHYISALR
jgi:hypothetical protein